MIKKLRTIALVLSIAAVLFATGPEVWSQAANAQLPPSAAKEKIVNKAILLFGVNLTSGKESPTFIQNVTQLAKEGFDTPENAKTISSA